METLTLSDACRRYPPAAPHLPGPAHAATLVTVLYLLLALGAPWIVRYAPATENSVVTRIADRPALIRCASAPGYGLPCGGSAAPGAEMPSLHVARHGSPVLMRQTSTRSIPPALARAT